MCEMCPFVCICFCTLTVVDSNMSLQDAINSASSITQTLSGELADGQRKFLAIAAAGANSNAMNPLVSQLSNGTLAGLHEIVCSFLSPFSFCLGSVWLMDLMREKKSKQRGKCFSCLVNKENNKKIGRKRT